MGTVCCSSINKNKTINNSQKAKTTKSNNNNISIKANTIQTDTNISNTNNYIIKKNADITTKDLIVKEPFKYNFNIQNRAVQTQISFDQSPDEFLSFHVRLFNFKAKNLNENVYYCFKVYIYYDLINYQEYISNVMKGKEVKFKLDENVNLKSQLNQITYPFFQLVRLNNIKYVLN